MKRIQIQARLISFTQGDRLVSEEWFDVTTPWEVISEHFEQHWHYNPGCDQHDLHITGTK